VVLQLNVSQESQLKVFALEDSSRTAHELLAGGYDIVVVSYEFLEHSYRNIRDLPEVTAKFRAGKGQKPKRPPTALFSDCYSLLNENMKRIIFDECQRVKNPRGARHEAAKRLRAHSRILLSETFLDNA
jgi:SNF2 family DNA or RNA helicase